MIRVENRRNTTKGEYVGRPSVLGNPFSHEVGTLAAVRVESREEAVSRYETWLRQKIAQGDPHVRAELNRLWKIAKAGDLVLLCWCAPKSCHADVIRKILEEHL